VFSQLRVTRWAFDAEVPLLAQRLGFTVAEVPVTWTNDERTRVRLAMAPAQSFLGLLRMVWNAASGRYRRMGDATAETGQRLWLDHGVEIR
jgi:hypothetical protein